MKKECKMCHGMFDRLAHSHIVPRGLIPDSPKNGKQMRSFGDRGLGRKLPNALWDEGILCDACEKDLGKYDNYAVMILRDARNAQSGMNGQHRVHVWSQVDRKLLRGFLASLLWRFSVSQLQECKAISIGANYEERIAKDVKSNGSFDYVDAIITSVKSDISEIIIPPKSVPRQCDDGAYADIFVLSVPRLKICVSLGAASPFLGSNKLDVMVDGEMKQTSLSVSDQAEEAPFAIPIMEMLPSDKAELLRCFLENEKQKASVHRKNVCARCDTDRSIMTVTNAR